MGVINLARPLNETLMNGKVGMGCSGNWLQKGVSDAVYRTILLLRY